MRRLLVLAFGGLLLLGGGCRSSAPAAAPEAGEEGARAVSPGLTLLPYEGVFEDYRPLVEALDGLSGDVDAARSLLRRRLGIELDPDRPRELGFRDGRDWTLVETRPVGSRLVQEIAIPSAPIAQQWMTIDAALAEALCAAAMTDPANEPLPAWFRRGAPLWVSGLWERELMTRMLAGPTVVLSLDRLVPPLDLASARPDRLSAALFLRCLADEFGADRLPALTRSLLAAGSPAEAFPAGLGADADSLPVAFDGYRVRTVSELTEDPFVRELAVLRDRDAGERVQRLTGLADRAPNRYVGVAILELLGLSQYESGDFEGAADTLGQVLRAYPSHVLRPDRNRLYFALSFSRRGEESAAALRLETFLAEFPASDYTPLALFELGSLLLRTGRAPDAIAKYEELERRFPEDPLSRESLLVLAAYDEARHRYGKAARSLEKALPDPTARRRLEELQPRLRAPLPEGASGLVDEALDDLASRSEEDRRAGAEVLVEVGPAAGSRLWSRAEEIGERSFLLDAVGVVAAWPREQALVWLTRFLTEEDAQVVGAVFDRYLELGMTPEQIGGILEQHPMDTPAADRLYEERYGRAAPGVTNLLASDDHRDRVEAARILSSEEGPDVIESLARLARDPSPQVRRAAAAALGLRPEAEARTHLLSSLDDESPLVRLEAVDSLLRLGAVEPVRSRALSDPDSRVRLHAARRILDLDPPGGVEQVIALLGDPDGGVSSGVEVMLKTSGRPSVGPALSEALRTAESPGFAMRIVRVMSHHAGRDLGYDPQGGAEERTRVAMEFLRWWGDRAVQR